VRRRVPTVDVAGLAVDVADREPLAVLYIMSERSLFAVTMK
jgi:hypothetical protein